MYIYVIYKPPLYPRALPSPTLYRSHDARVGIPAQQGVLTIAGLGVVDVGPVAEKIFLAENARQVARQGTVDVFHEGEVGGEEDVEVALLNLWWEGDSSVSEEERQGEREKRKDRLTKSVLTGMTRRWYRV